MPQKMSDEALRAWIKSLTAEVCAKEAAMGDDLEEPLPPMEFDECAGFRCEFPDCDEEIEEAGTCAKHTKMLAKFDVEQKENKECH